MNKVGGESVFKSDFEDVATHVGSSIRRRASSSLKFRRRREVPQISLTSNYLKMNMQIGKHSYKQTI